MTDPLPALYTVGYEGCSLDGLIDCLRTAGVAVVLDVRDAPFSRKPGFSKAPLEAGLTAAGLRYLHLPGLGNPKAARDAAKAGDVEGSRGMLRDRLAGAAGQRDLAAAAELAERSPACLLCFEAAPERCHRVIVADEIVARTGQRIAHLRPVPTKPSAPADSGPQLSFGFGDPGET